MSAYLTKNNIFFVFLLLGYVFGVLLYDFLNFNYTDELMALFLGGFALVTVVLEKRIYDLKRVIVVFFIFILYLIYSIIIGSNTIPAILSDLASQIKPFVCFFCTLCIKPRFSKEQKKFLAAFALISTGLLLLLAISGDIELVMGHVSRFATAATITAFIYLYCCAFDWKDIVVFFLILGLGLFSTRSKFYGFMFFAILFTVICKTGFKFKFSIKSILLVCLLFIGVIIVSWSKIQYYFIIGLNGSDGQMFARPALYVVGFAIFLDYIPLGSGLASFATFASGEFYSKTYTKYHINHFFGLSKDNPAFIADSFYPSLAQFGLIGLMLYVYFWIYLMKIANRYKKRCSVDKNYLTVVLVICFFLIEGIADCTFTQNRGLFMLLLVAMTISLMEDFLKPAPIKNE